MLLEQYDWGIDARTLQVLFALGLGLLLGGAAQITRFCLRRAIVPEAAARGPAGAICCKHQLSGGCICGLH